MVEKVLVPRRAGRSLPSRTAIGGLGEQSADGLPGDVRARIRVGAQLARGRDDDALVEPRVDRLREDKLGKRKARV